MSKMKQVAENTSPGKFVQKDGEVSNGGITRWLGSAIQPGQEIHSDFDLLKAGQDGIPKASIDELATHLGISRKSMAEDILSVSVKTLERKAKTARMDKKTSSHALEIAKIMQHAYEVFEDEQKVKSWMNQVNRALDGKKPVQILDTLTGLNMVNDILTRIEEGVYS
jgi:putative toxin-antitoxin system antitoxin component (TIGR02293 family)